MGKLRGGYCPECGAPTNKGGSCREHFHALLILEWEIPGGPTRLGHFFAVACYGLQHPDGMNYTADALAGLREGVADLLDRRINLDEYLLRTRRAVNNATRVTRRPGDPAVAWRRGDWPMNIADVLTVERETAAYVERVTQWARSIGETLDADGVRPA